MVDLGEGPWSRSGTDGTVTYPGLPRGTVVLSVFEGDDMIHSELVVLGHELERRNVIVGDSGDYVVRVRASDGKVVAGVKAVVCRAVWGSCANSNGAGKW